MMMIIIIIIIIIICEGCQFHEQLSFVSKNRQETVINLELPWWTVILTCYYNCSPSWTRIITHEWWHMLYKLNNDNKDAGVFVET